MILVKCPKCDHLLEKDGTCYRCQERRAIKELG